MSLGRFSGSVPKSRVPITTRAGYDQFHYTERPRRVGQWSRSLRLLQGRDP